MIPNQAEGPDNISTRAKRPKPTSGSQWLVMLVMVLVYLPLLVSAARLQNTLETAQCPISTFYLRWIVTGSSPFIFGLMIVVICPIVIIIGGGKALRLPQFETSLVPSASARKAYTVVTAIGLIGLAIGWCALIDGADRFFCLSPAEIMIRRGLGDTAHHYSWRDVRTMYVSCLISRLPKEAPFPAADVNLELRNGEQVVVGLRGTDKRTLTSLKTSLNGVDYKFYVNRTVTPEYCPAELYQHIWSWLDE